eukprot:scaffold4911_cov100-Cylindrotheca_fusiformis.AAC.4
MCNPIQKGLLATRPRRNETGTTAAAIETLRNQIQHHPSSKSSAASSPPPSSSSSSSWKTLVANDDSLLLKACLNYAWKDVIQCCSTLLSMLLLEESMATEPLVGSFFLASNKERIQRQLNQRDPWGNTPLLAACHYDPPIVVIQMLLLLASKVSMDIHTAVNSIGASPLVIFCNSGGGGRRRRKNMAIVSLLLQQQKQDQQLPLSILTDNQGNSVFQGLLNRYQLLCKVPSFSRVYSASLDVVPTTRSREEQDEQDDSCNLNDGEELLDTFWMTVRSVIEAASRPGWTLLQGAAHMAPLLPKEITRFIFRYHILRYHYSQQQQEKEEGPDDNTKTASIPPLHGAVSSYEALHRRENINQNALQIWRNQTEYFVQQLLLADPSAALNRHSQHGRLPWTQTIASGLSWNSTTTTTTGTVEVEDDDKRDGQLSDFSSSSLLQHLLQLYPPALEEQDPVTGLDPAFLAATTVAVSNNMGRDRPLCSDKDTAQLDTIYSLLRLNPTVVRKGL